MAFFVIPACGNRESVFIATRVHRPQRLDFGFRRNDGRFDCPRSKGMVSNSVIGASHTLPR